jgi:hypothetical protein
VENKQAEKSQAEKTPIAISKSFMTAGPTLHYSHENVQRCWIFALSIFCLTGLFWSKILTGSFWSLDFNSIMSGRLWQLGQYTTTGVSIFEYPWQILVLGLLMGILAITPLLISQLMSFIYSLPFILVVAFLANLPGFAVSLLISCVAVACRPLRFRSRFTAIALCTSPQVLYWGVLGGATSVEPLKWGFSFTPWICAWLTGLAIGGVVLGIGHFIRYKPGLVWISAFITLLIAFITFEVRIGFDELDYQLYIAKNNPEQISEFHNHSITERLDEQITKPSANLRRHIESRFYPTEPIALRAKLKEKIQMDLQLYDRWPSWFHVTRELNYQGKKQWLFEQYDLFINRRPKSPRMPIALYYKALLSEYSPDIIALERDEVLQFYSDYPYERSLDTWYWLYTEFGNSPESLEARWRIARNLASQGKFEQTDNLLTQAQTMIAVELMKRLEKEKTQSDKFFSLFSPPADSAMTALKLAELQRKVNRFRSLISTENRTNNPESANRLAKFVTLNPHSQTYPQQLNELSAQMSSTDPLRDNVLLAQIKLIADEQLRAEKLSQLHKEFQNTDGGMEALYELGLLKISLWRHQDDTNAEQKKKFMAETRATLTSFIKLYPGSIYTEQVKKNLDNLPAN